MSKTDNQIVGLIRFSFIAEGGFAKKNHSQAQRERVVFAPERMELRFELFKKLALRSLLQQSDQGFRCVFLISESFPQEYRERLETLVSPLQGAIIMERGYMHQHSAIRQCYDSLRDENCRYFTSFRLDDDDMVDADYIRRLKKLSVPLAKIHNSPKPLVLAFNKGIYLEIGDEQNRIFDATERAPLSIGTAMIAPTTTRKINPYTRNHRILPAFFSTYSDITTPTWLRSIHVNNVSTPAFTGKVGLHSDEEIDGQLHENFAISREELMAIRL